jgi:hypothetical protein
VPPKIEGVNELTPACGVSCAARHDEVAFKWGFYSAVRSRERRQDVMGAGSDPGVDVV